MTDWVVVRNRQTTLASRNRAQYRARPEAALGDRAGFRLADGISERVIFRELFPARPDGAGCLRHRHRRQPQPTLSHISARNEVRNLLDTLNLPALRTPPGAVRDAAATAAGAPLPDDDDRLRDAL